MGDGPGGKSEEEIHDIHGNCSFPQDEWFFKGSQEV